jgi:Flp pilus assembly pilin Flp
MRSRQRKGAAGALRRILLRFIGDLQAQDMIEYALMAAAVAVGAAAVLPSATASIGIVFSKIGSLLSLAASS